MIIDLHAGRRRATLHLLYVLVVVAGASVWFGNAGTGLLFLWGLATWPRWRRLRIEVSLAEVRQVRLYTGALLIRCFHGRLIWVLADELPHAEYAAIRRTLKMQLQGLL